MTINVVPAEPEVIILAGPNGAGKTTVASALMASTEHINFFLNADIIARSLAPEAAESVAITAGKVMRRRIDVLVQKRESFLLETTLAARTYVNLINWLRADGYRVVLYFISLDSPELAISRVQTRVALGGHAIPEATIRSRYRAGLTNFFRSYMDIVDEWSIYHNNVDADGLIAYSNNKQLEIVKRDKWDLLSESYGK